MEPRSRENARLPRPRDARHDPRPRSAHGPSPRPDRPGRSRRLADADEQCGDPEPDRGTIEVPVIRADGQRLLVELSLSRWEQAGSTRFTAVLRDITARRRTELLVGLVAQAAHTANEAESLLEARPECHRGNGVPDPEAALRDADAALRLAKRRGKGRLEIFDSALRDDAAKRPRDETDLERAIISDQLTIHYQPILDLDTATPTAAEALVRWPRPGYGLIYPDDFVPLAEESGFIVELGRWVLRRACADAAQWPTTTPALTEAAVSINVSPRQLVHPHFVEDVVSALRAARLPAERLILEVTESLLIEESDSIVSILSGLRALGIRIALDDFGKGYSSLSYLRRLPLDILKIDRSFIEPVVGSAEVPALSEVVLKLAGLLVCAPSQKVSPTATRSPRCARWAVITSTATHCPGRSAVGACRPLARPRSAAWRGELERAPGRRQPSRRLSGARQRSNRSPTAVIGSYACRS